ncbi:hypothetical protein, partial [Falsiroseomonas sp.]|uniref:hypothetical protein n=1 Tax=Falsiroseomonas sp. TaxID=2870721 RepID=UPI002719A4DA
MRNTIRLLIAAALLGAPLLLTAPAGAQLLSAPTPQVIEGAAAPPAATPRRTRRSAATTPRRTREARATRRARTAETR